MEQELEKHLQQQVAADLSAIDLEVHLTSLGHVYGAFVLHLLGTRPVRTAARSFKLALLMPERKVRFNNPPLSYMLCYMCPNSPTLFS